MSCTNCNDCENFCTSEITCVDANFTNISVAADATLNDVLEAIDEGLVGLVGPQGDQGIQGIQGPAGTNGTNGTNGADGARGNAGSNSLIWDSTDFSGIGGGFEANDSNFTSITEWSFNKTSKTGYSGVNGSYGNASAWLSAIAIGDIIQIHQVDDNTKFGIYTVTASSYYNPAYTFSVTILAGNSTFDANKQYTVSFVKKGASTSIPAGTIQMYAAMDAPEGWLVCNGDIVSTATYPNLFSVIGSTFNVGTVTGSNFQLPNFTGRVPVGLGLRTDVSIPILLADAYGEEFHNITSNQIPRHTHSITDPGHQHNVVANNGGAITPGINPAQAAITNSGTANPTLLANTNTTGITATNENTSGEQPIPLMQPYLGINFIIKY